MFKRIVFENELHGIERLSAKVFGAKYAWALHWTLRGWWRCRPLSSCQTAPAAWCRASAWRASDPAALARAPGSNGWPRPWENQILTLLTPLATFKWHSNERKTFYILAPDSPVHGVGFLFHVRGGHFLLDLVHQLLPVLNLLPPLLNGTKNQPSTFPVAEAFMIIVRSNVTPLVFKIQLMTCQIFLHIAKFLYSYSPEVIEEHGIYFYQYSSPPEVIQEPGKNLLYL